MSDMELILRTPARARSDGLAGQLHEAAELLGEVRADEFPGWHVNFAACGDAALFADQMEIDEVHVLVADGEDAAAIRAQLDAPGPATLH